jgi:hypothetical protein
MHWFPKSIPTILHFKAMPFFSVDQISFYYDQKPETTVLLLSREKKLLAYSENMVNGKLI